MDSDMTQISSISCKISDFGISIKSGVDNWKFMAPEVIRAQMTSDYYNPFLSDVFSCGVLFHLLVTMEMAFTKRELMLEKFDTREIAKSWPIMLREFISGFLHWESRKRKKFQVIIHFIFFSVSNYICEF